MRGKKIPQAKPVKGTELKKKPLGATWPGHRISFVGKGRTFFLKGKGEPVGGKGEEEKQIYITQGGGL